KFAFMAATGRYSDAKISEMKTTADKVSETAFNNFKDAQEKLDGLTKGTPEYKKAEKELSKATAQARKAAIDRMGLEIFDWIGGNVVKDLGTVFFNEASRLEETLGYAERKNWKKQDMLGKVEKIAS